MRRLLILSLGMFLVGITPIYGDSLFAQTEGEYGKEIKERKMSLPKCDKPAGRVVTRGFKCKAAACQGNQLVFSGGYTIQTTPQAMGDGLADMLLTALAETGCFEVYERETMKEIAEELKMLGKTPEQTLKGAELLITGSVTALEMKAGGMGGGGGGIVVPLPFIGGIGLKGGKEDAHIGLDLRVVRVDDAKILVSKAVEGKSGRWNLGIGGFGWFGGGGVGGWFESFKNTPLEEATRDVIAGAVTLIVNNLAKQNITGTLTLDESEKKVIEEKKGDSK